MQQRQLQIEEKTRKKLLKPAAPQQATTYSPIIIPVTGLLPSQPHLTRTYHLIRLPQDELN